MSKSPGIVFACQFVTAGAAQDLKLNFADHAIGYIARDKAQLEKAKEQKPEVTDNKKINVTEGGYLGREYATNPFYNEVTVEGHKINFGYDEDDDICTGVFTANKDELSKYDEWNTASQFNIAQDNGNCLYTSVISFDNEFLEKNGIDPRTGKGQKLLRECTRQGAAELFKNSHLDLDNIVWSAGIHYNTNHIHIHLDFAEVNATNREKNVIEVKAFDKLKSTIANKISKNDYVIEFDKIIRNTFVQNIRLQARDYQELIMPLIAGLPKNIPWEYNRKDMIPYQQLINNTIDNIVSANPELKAEFVKFEKELKEYRDYRRDLYGEGKRNKADEGAKNKLLDFYSRTGNALLKEAKEISGTLDDLKLIELESEISEPDRQSALRGSGALTEEKNTNGFSDSYFDETFKKAQLKDLKSVYRLGSMLEYGSHTEKNIEAALYCYEAAAVSGNVDAMYKVSKLTEDEFKRKDFLQAAAQNGHDGAMFLLGKEYEQSDIGLSEFYYKKAGLKDNAWAQLRLLKLYENNKSMFSDITEKDIKTLQKSAYLNLFNSLIINPENEYVRRQVGIMQLTGTGTKIDYAGAVENLNHCADKNSIRELQRISFNKVACTELKLCADKGQKLAQNALLILDNVQKQIKPYAEQSKPYKEAQQELRSLNFEKAFNLMENEAMTGNVYALYDLAKIYDNGLGVEKNSDMANQYYKLSLGGMKIINTEKQDSYLQYRIGKMYQYGLGAETNLQEALNWYEQSANTGNNSAQYSAGNMYYTGNGTEVNYKKATDYFTAAAEKGNAFSSYNLGEIYEKGKDVEINPDIANENYKNAFTLFEKQEAQTKDDNIQYRLGTMLRDGKGTDIDIHKAIDYFNLSGKQGNNNSIIALSKIYSDKSSNYYDPLKAEQKLKTVSENNDYAKYELAILYLSSDQKKPEKAVKLLEDLAPKNNSAKYLLGCLYLDKNNPSHNIGKGVETLKELIADKNDKAMLRLGCFHMRSGNKEIANSYYHQAAAVGNKFAEKFLQSSHYQKMCERAIRCDSANKDYKAQKQKIKINTAASMNRLNKEYKTHIKDLEREFEYEQNLQHSLNQSEEYNLHYQ